MVTTRQALRAVPNGKQRVGLKIDRHFTTPEVHPYDELEWELRDAVITDWRSGEVSFEQRDVEFPRSWSLNATTIVAQKYFRGTMGTPERERSVRQMIDRVADTIAGWGRADGYFAPPSSSTCSSTRWRRSTPRSGSTAASRSTPSAPPASSCRSRTR
jgi:ribonucleoside-diphosphate reductase alpha chain